VIAWLEAQRCAQRAKDRSNRHIRPVELIRECLSETNSNAPRATLYHQGVALVPHAVGQPHHQRVDRREDAASGHICAHVAFERAAIDQNRYRGRWE
jgi:hypothetical protein